MESAAGSIGGEDVGDYLRVYLNDVIIGTAPNKGLNFYILASDFTVSN